MSYLYEQSIQIIKDGQSASGAYIACPNFDTYKYCWLRDGAFIAYAMDLTGEHESAASFHRWVATTLPPYRGKVERVKLCLAQGIPLQDRDFLHTRFTAEGDEVSVDPTWGNFQLDGYGTWLWSLGEHLRKTNDLHLLKEAAPAVALVTQYIHLVWSLPSYDCWEEHPEYQHSYTLGAAWAGLNAVVSMESIYRLDLPAKTAQTARDAIYHFLCEHGTEQGRLVKHIAPSSNGNRAQSFDGSKMDASLVALAVPYQVFSTHDPLMQATLRQIESDLWRPGGGVYRYCSDTYYGGGEWLLLAAWLGWYYAAAGEDHKANQLLAWLVDQQDSQGNLPEQVSDHLLSSQYFPIWQRRWGTVAKPLLWSHAMYLILDHALHSNR